MDARRYFDAVQAAIRRHAFVVYTTLHFEEIAIDECYIKGCIGLSNGLELHIAEYVVTSPTPKRLKYRYHLQQPGGRMLVRWDNAPHHQHISTFPDHRHDSDGSVHPSSAVDIFQVLTLIVPFLSEDAE